MKLWYISQTANHDYDTFDSAIVAAETEEDAAKIHPGSGEDITTPRKWPDRTWVTDPAQVVVDHIGEAKDGTECGPIVSSFNAG